MPLCRLKIENEILNIIAALTTGATVFNYLNDFKDINDLNPAAADVQTDN